MTKETPLELLQMKLEALQRREVLATDAAETFKLGKDIRDVEAQIAKLSSGSGHGAKSDLPAVVPQGLKSFGEDAKGFFLRLLPGPYHQNGLPESLHFWKRQVEQTDADETFRVGVIYGKSGCGKSSWIKAGLLPRLEGVTSVYVEAIPDGTPQRLLAALRKRCQWLGDGASLVELLQRKDSIPESTKVLIVLDQFEQWLHGRVEENYGELLDALRACDGSRVQCLLLIRSDFWDLLTRFLQRLGVRQEEGKNLAMFDLFDKRHARHVLTLFGEAFKALPQSGERTPDQETFLNQAVDGLAEDGRIVCVRLSLFAEMLKRRDWIPATLRQIGGTSGVGFAFLEENFSAKEAPLQYRRHEAAARAILERLLPAVTDIKGAMQSEEELRSRSGYERRPEEFADLLQILNEKLRLITPTAPVEAAIDRETADADSSGVASDGAKYYQLTHDYLVPSLRDWITAKHKATRRGRAQLRLDERSAAWNAKPENRHLPAWWEDLSIRWFTRSRDWTEPQRRMMRAAGRFHGLWAAGIMLLVAVGTGIGLNVRHKILADQAKGYVDAAILAPAPALPYALENVLKLPDYTRPLLEQMFGDGPVGIGDDDLAPALKLHGLCALAALGQVRADALIGHVTREPPHPAAECPNIVAALAASRETALREMQTAWEAEPKAALKARLAIVALFLGDVKPASDMCQLGPDPTQWTAFVAAFPAWYGDLGQLAGDVDRLELTNDPGLLSALCQGLGSLTVVDRQTHDLSAWRPCFEAWFQSHHNSGVHSAAGWALRQWGIDEPPLPSSDRPLDGSDWFVTESALTLNRIPAGEFVRQDHYAEAKPQTVVLTHDLWLSSREVTVQLFREFAEDKKYAEEHSEGVLDRWGGESRFESPNPLLDHPVQQVSWEDAVKLCNWLSWRENRTPCYRQVKPDEGTEEAVSVWELNPAATGYRLPTEAEWEYACRAGTAVEYDFSFGNAEELLADYGWFQANSGLQTQPIGMKKPNGWGLHDMHGNVWEWCQDWYEAYGDTEPPPNPIGPLTGSYRVYRGGCWDYSAWFCRSAYRDGNTPSLRFSYLGFRVALVLSSQARRGGSSSGGP